MNGGIYVPPALPAESGFRSLGSGGRRSPAPISSRRSLLPPARPSRSRASPADLPSSLPRDLVSLLRSRPRPSSPPRRGLLRSPPRSPPPLPSSSRSSRRAPSSSGLWSRRFEGFRRRSLSDDEELEELELERAISKDADAAPWLRRMGGGISFSPAGSVCCIKQAPSALSWSFDFFRSFRFFYIAPASCHQESGTRTFLTYGPSNDFSQGVQKAQFKNEGCQRSEGRSTVGLRHTLRRASKPASLISRLRGRDSTRFQGGDTFARSFTPHARVSA